MHAGLEQAVAPPGLLSAAEQARCDRLVIEKRRRDWLLGRWTAKHLVQFYLASGGGLSPLDRIEILSDDDGAPYVRVGERLPLSLSISHSGLDSFCALCPSDAGVVGADVEQVEPRESAFVRTFFTDLEIRGADAAATGRDAFVTAVWSAKEAVLKTLRLGLRADTRQVEIQVIDQGPGWVAVGAAVQTDLLPSPTSTIAVWQQVEPARVLSLALLQP